MTTQASVNQMSRLMAGILWINVILWEKSVIFNPNDDSPELQKSIVNNIRYIETCFIECFCKFVWNFSSSLWDPYDNTSTSLNNEQCLNLLRPSDEGMRQWIGPPFVVIMACRLFGAKLLSEPVRAHCQFHCCEHISLKFQLNHINHINSNISSATWRDSLVVVFCFVYFAPVSLF